jgi:hypothetical protein
MPTVKIPWSDEQANDWLDGVLYNLPYSIPCIGEDRHIAEEMLKLGHTKYTYKGYEHEYPNDYNHILEVNGIQA